MDEKLENNDLAFQVYSKIVNIDGPKFNQELFVAGSYFAMAKYYFGRQEYANSRELFVKFFICGKNIYDLNQKVEISLFNEEPVNIATLWNDSVPMLQATGELNHMKFYHLAVNS